MHLSLIQMDAPRFADTSGVTIQGRIRLGTRTTAGVEEGPGLVKATIDGWWKLTPSKAGRISAASRSGKERLLPGSFTSVVYSAAGSMRRKIAEAVRTHLVGKIHADVSMGSKAIDRAGEVAGQGDARLWDCVAIGWCIQSRWRHAVVHRAAQ